MLKLGCTQVLGIPRRLDPPIGAEHKCFRMPRCLVPQGGHLQVLDLKPRLRTSVLDLKPGPHTSVLDLKPGLHTGVWIPNRGYTQVFGSPNGRSVSSLQSFCSLLGIPSQSQVHLKVPTCASKA